MGERPPDEELERSTNRWMAWGFGIMVLMVLIFPIYRFYEPTSREADREAQLEFLADQGAGIYELNCASCHGVEGQGGIGPALNSMQFLEDSSDEQTITLIAVGVPGSQMSAYSLDFGGPLTSEQIKAIATFIRSWEETAPDVPNWRDPLGLAGG
ncbi:MAG: cytochrome c [Acidimicrobiia bacterium]|nr:cytochrome c [Acidimicrobiia bacterium]